MSRQFPARPRRFRDLAAYLASTGDPQASVAARNGTTQPHISRIARGLLVPRAELARRLAEDCRIPLSSFMRVYLAKRKRSGALVA